MNKLENIKVGDKLFVYIRYQEQIETVTNMTETLAITDGHRFRIKDGMAIPTDKWINTYAMPATPEDIESVEKENVRRENIMFCDTADFSNLTYEQLERIVNIIKSEQQ